MRKLDRIRNKNKKRRESNITKIVKNNLSNNNKRYNKVVVGYKKEIINSLS